jgi:hypothetical protein
MVDGKMAKQLVLMHEEIAKRFRKMIRGNVFIGIHPPAIPLDLTVS